MGKKSNSIARRNFVRMSLYSAAGVCVGAVVARANLEDEPIEKLAQNLENFDWAFVVDTTRCIGCGSCVRACAIENNIPDTYFRTWIERYEIDEDENVHVDSPKGGRQSFKHNRVQDKQIVKGFFVPKLCNHCRNSSVQVIILLTELFWWTGSTVSAVDIVFRHALTDVAISGMSSALPINVLFVITAFTMDF